MSTEVKVPVLPESVADATVAAWHKQPGDSIRRDENLLDLETDKVVLEVPSPVDGVVSKVVRDSGETVVSGELLGLIEEGTVEEQDSVDSEAGPGGEDKSQPAEKDLKTSADEDKAKPATDTARLSPAARRVAEEEKADLSQLSGTGRGGRITKADVMQHVQGAGPVSARPEERVKMTRLRSTIAARMKDAQNTAAILTSFNEVDLKAVMDLRRKYKEAFENQHGVKLGLMSFFVKAVCDALRKHPVINASLEGDEIVYHGYQDIGIAVSTERGLMVPILKDAGHMTLADAEHAIRDFASRARDGSITLEELQGGTFSITNGGTFGSLLSTPLLNPPQSAILGMHTIKERAVVVDGEIKARPMMYIALSYDHRIIDGKDAVQFLVAVKDVLEDPARLLLNL
ncbi:MAG: 2-oxoglutarate dehydrogenase complex dihydrolipoyllysine-residue succinyltransferase [Xanthomonadales bacterium]|nr:2-oxoglutarate dehydrogenase complex dihydrolipoyllysine-residue succinyltransferase [Xanthomonadales bacterium]